MFPAAKNGVVYELWQNIGTNFIAKLKEDPRFPSNPDKMEILPNFESAKNFADNYGARLTTYYRVCAMDIFYVTFVSYGFEVRIYKINYNKRRKKNQE